MGKHGVRPLYLRGKDRVQSQSRWSGGNSEGERYQCIEENKAAQAGVNTEERDKEEGELAKREKVKTNE